MGKHFSFIHCADLHLGEPLGGMNSEEKGPWTDAVNKATFSAFERVVDAAAEAHADAILITGDVYNSDHHSLVAQMAFARELYRAAEQGIQIFITHGNHDSAEAWRADIPLPPQVHIFSAEKTEALPLTVGGETVATVYGISYRTRHIRENLAKTFQRKEDDGFAIAMLHTDMKADSPYAPCTEEELRAAGMDYWALGHVHTRKIVSTSPYIVYPGNTQGLSIAETGARGCWLVDVGMHGTVTMQFIETCSIRWMDMICDISQYENQDELLRDIKKRRAALRSEGKPYMIRLIFRGRGKLHRMLVSESGREFILQTLNEKEKFRHMFAFFIKAEDETQPMIDLQERRRLPDVMGKYLQAYDRAAALTPAEKLLMLREIAARQPEMKKLRNVFERIDDGMILRAFQKAELVGAELLAEEDTDENH